ncbi:MAG TPA: glycolate oxidase subunit GlcF [Anaerolineae bacterium]|nr:glycolate oxidase subunit GlcF [Anaerolineae bacterium]HRV92479.1 glycolate oxidase subunit GlcF [Anaerolineae bacterium]
MQHRIDINKYGPRGQTMAEAIQSCVHCGFCLAACPTYKVLGEEMDSPRGRIYLMKEVLEEKLSIEEAQPYLDRCLGCIGCVPTCPSGVRYDELIVSYRAFSEPQRRRSLTDSMARRMIAETLPYPSRFRKAVASGKVGKLFKGAMPEKMGAMLGLIPTDLPVDKPLPPFYPAKGKRRAKVALLSGCVQTVLDPDINWATLRVLSENGVEIVIPQAQGCCGSIMMHIGEEERAKKLARQNLQAFRPNEVDAIITNAAGCGSGMKEYGLLFKGLPEESEAEEFAHKVQDITVFLDKLGFKPPAALPEPLTVAYQDACHLLHAQGIRNPPRNLLASIPNLTLLEVGDGGLCCGSAGTYNIEQPEIAHQLGQRKVQHILNTGAQAVVSGNIGCLTQIQTHLTERGISLPLFHTVKLLDWAYRQTN